MRFLACILLPGCLLAQQLSVAVTVNIVPSGSIASAITRDLDGNGRIDRIEMGFSGPVNISDLGGAADGLPCLALSDGYVIAPGDYGGVGLTSLVLLLNEAALPDTAATPTVTYNASGGAAISGQTDGANLIVSDGARPVPAIGAAPPAVLRVPTVTVSWVFSEPVSALVGGDLTLVNATLISVTPAAANTWLATVAPTQAGSFSIGLINGAVQDTAANPSRVPALMSSTWFPPAADAAVRVSGATLAGTAPNGASVRVDGTTVIAVGRAWSVAVPLPGDDPKRITIPVRQIDPVGKRPIGENVTIDIAASDPGGGG